MNNTIFLTGSGGFLGKNISEYLRNSFKIKKYNRSSEIKINEKIVINLAGKAHDLNNTLNPNEYYEANTYFSNSLYDSFLKSEAETFITISSIKSVKDSYDGIIDENTNPDPLTHYGKSKLLADQYILNSITPKNKRFIILRPCMIHGPMNKGNLNYLYSFIYKGFPWPLGSYENQRSYCGIDNFCFIIKELINQKNIPSGIYNISDENTISTNQIVSLIAKSLKRKIAIFKIPRFVISFIAKLGGFFSLSINTHNLNKLTENYIVSNKKLLNVLEKKLPFSLEEGLIKTFDFFKKEHHTL
jgi:nucleoside-diphosphate-sugar epimerase